MIQQMAARHHVCDVVVAVIRNRALAFVSAASGCTPEAAHPDAVFKAASLGKPVFAYAVLQLARQGRLALDAPLVRYLPRGYMHLADPFSGTSGQGDLVTDPRLAKVTARMVLTHTSGLPNWTDGPLGFAFEPGDRWQYSGEGYLLLQRVVETITGESMSRYMVDHVFGPLGMSSSSYVWEDRFQPRFVTGHAQDGAPRGARRFKSPVVATTLYTTATDYGRFVVALLNDPQALDASTSAPVRVDAELHLEWGLGWGIEREPGDTLLWHWGSTSGYRSLVVVSPVTGSGFVMFTNSDGGMSLGRPIANSLFPREPQLLDFRMLQ